MLALQMSPKSIYPTDFAGLIKFANQHCMHCMHTNASRSTPLIFRRRTKAILVNNCLSSHLEIVVSR